MAQNPLIGRALIKVELAEDREAIRFTLADGEVIARCDADCCSHTWIEAVENTVTSFPATVLAVEPLALTVWGTEDETHAEWDGGNLVRFYGCKVTTDRGLLIIDYRNESNGYYGGSLVWPDERFYGGVYDQQTAGESGVWQELP